MKTIQELQYWFATNKTEFDVSASGFANWVNKYGYSGCVNIVNKPYKQPKADISNNPFLNTQVKNNINHE